MNKDDAIKKLKEAKELRDLDVFSKDEYKALVDQFKPLLLEKSEEAFTFNEKPYLSKRIANALIKDVSVNGATDVFLDTMGAIGATVFLEGLKSFYGGLWVGGNVYLFEDRIEFKANKMNVAVHKGVTNITLPLNRIIDVNIEFGVITKIINISTLNGVFKLRCYKAKDFLEEILNLKRKIKPTLNNKNNIQKSSETELLNYIRKIKITNYTQIFDCYTIFKRDFNSENTEINNLMKLCAKKQFRGGEEKMFYEEYLSRKLKENANYIDELDIRNLSK